MNKPDHHRSEALQQQYARHITQRLTASTGELPYDISERLRAARMQALAKRKVVSLQTAPAVATSGNSATLTLGGGGGFSLWRQLASALPLIALVAGLVAINIIQDDDRTSELAEVDAALLTDDLPPDAYADPGFVQFLKTSHSRETH